MTRLDTPGAPRYIAALFLAAGLMFSATAWAKDVVVKGAVLPPWSSEVGENRYKSPMNWVDTKTWLDRNYPRERFIRKTIVNQPGVRGFHIVNESRSGEWEGLNVYELDGETRFFVVLRDPPKAKSEK